MNKTASILIALPQTVSGRNWSVSRTIWKLLPRCIWIAVPFYGSALLAFSAPIAIATILFVSPTGNDNNAGTMAAPYRTIQAAINNTATGDTVTLEDGTYSGGGNCDLDFGGKNLTVNSQHGPGKTIIDCGGVPATPHRAFYFHAKESAVIAGLTIQNGEIANSGTVHIEAGCTVTLTDCNFVDNHTVGIYNLGTVELTNCTLTRNTAAGINTRGTATLTGCTISRNSEPKANNAVNVRRRVFGDGIDGIVSGGKLSLTGCTIDTNSGIGVNCSGSATLTKCKINSNGRQGVSGWDLVMDGCTVKNNQGGGVDAHDTLQMIHCTISGNMDAGIRTVGGSGVLVNCTLTNCTVSDNKGGGVQNFGSLAQLENCTLSDNTAYAGGGVYNTGRAILSNCILSKNIAQAIPKQPDGNQLPPRFMGHAPMGGGLYNQGVLVVQHCTLYGNIAEGANAQGGALENDSEVTLTNCILWGNTAPNAEAIGIANVGNPVTNTTYCNIQGGLNSTGNIKADPLFVDAAHGDLHLQANSPCIGKGAVITSDAPPVPVQPGRRSHRKVLSPKPVTSDLDGKPRGAMPTMGAYEGAGAQVR